MGFASPYLGDVNVQVSQLLFSASYLIGVKASKTYKELSQKQSDLSKVDVVSNVTKAYYGVIINEYRLELMEYSLEQLDSLYNQTKVLYEVGLAEEIDFQQVEVNYNNLLNEKRTLERLIVLNMAQLKFQMGMKLDEEISLSDKIDDEFLAELDTSKVESDFSDRIEFDILNTNITLQELSLRNYKSQYLPTFSAFGNFGFNTGASSLGGTFSNSWLSYSLVGLNLSIPVFDGLRKSALIQQTKLEIEKLENQKSLLLKQMSLELTQANVSFYGSLDRYKSQKDNLELAKSVYESTIKKQRIGVSSTQEVLDIRTLYKETETNYYTALYDLLISKVDREKALGVLVK